MPITRLTRHYLSGAVSAEWIYLPDEDIDFSKFMDIKFLYISASAPIVTKTKTLDAYDPEPEVKPYTLPSLLVLFPELVYLRIFKQGMVKKHDVGHRELTPYCELPPCFIGGITDIPVSVKYLIIEDSYIEDFTSSFRYGMNLLYFILKGNVTPVSWSFPLPNTLERFDIDDSTVTGEITFPDSIRTIMCLKSNLPIIHGLNNARPCLELVMDGCTTPYDNNVLKGTKIPTKEKVKHITKVNAQHQYLELGSIPRRIRISTEEDLYNPIIIAMKLASNYPRRMAEFVAITEVRTEFATNNPLMLMYHQA